MQEVGLCRPISQPCLDLQHFQDSQPRKFQMAWLPDRSIESHYHYMNLFIQYSELLSPYSLATMYQILSSRAAAQKVLLILSFILHSSYYFQIFEYPIYFQERPTRSIQKIFEYPIYFRERPTQSIRKVQEILVHIHLELSLFCGLDQVLLGLFLAR